MEFEVVCYMPGLHPRSILYVTRSVVGHTILEDQKLLNACNIATGLPKQAAVLTIRSENTAMASQNFVIHGHSQLLPDLDTMIEELSIIGIAQKFPKKPVSHILDVIRAFSRDRAGALMIWLRALRDKCQQTPPCIIVVDTTGKTELPWELFEIETYHYLGATTQIVRWHPFRPFGKQKLLEVKESVYEGPVLAYLDQALAATDRENLVLQRFRKRDLASLQGLKALLFDKGSLAQIGLVYIACHGEGSKRLLANDNSADVLQEVDEDLRDAFCGETTESLAASPSVSSCSVPVVISGRWLPWGALKPRLWLPVY